MSENDVILFVNAWYNEFGPLHKTSLKELVTLCEKKSIMIDIVRGDDSQKMINLRQFLVNLDGCVVGEYKFTIGKTKCADGFRDAFQLEKVVPAESDDDNEDDEIVEEGPVSEHIFAHDPTSHVMMRVVRDMVMFTCLAITLIFTVNKCVGDSVSTCVARCNDNKASAAACYPVCGRIEK